jgi:hypothetical protein
LADEILVRWQELIDDYVRSGDLPPTTETDLRQS